jgi:hypothetical protein
MQRKFAVRDTPQYVLSRCRNYLLSSYQMEFTTRGKCAGPLQPLLDVSRSLPDWIPLWIILLTDSKASLEHDEAGSMSVWRSSHSVTAGVLVQRRMSFPIATAS